MTGFKWLTWVKFRLCVIHISFQEIFLFSFWNFLAFSVLFQRRWLQRDSKPQPLTVRKRTLNHLAIWRAWLNGRVFVYELNGCGFESRCSHLYPVAVTSDIAPVSRKDFLDIQATKEDRFTLKRVTDMIRIYSQLFQCIHKHSEHFLLKVNDRKTWKRCEIWSNV